MLGLATFLAVAHSGYRSLSAQKKTAQQSAVFSRGMTLPDDFSLESLGGKDKGLADFGGKVLLINFWAGWCTPCLSEMPGLYSLQNRLRDRGLEVLAVNMDEDPQDGLRVLRQKVGEAPFSMFKGAGTTLASQFAIGGLPYTVVINRDRKILFAQAGQINWAGSEAVTLIEETL